jgi:hypothetical protein
MSIKSLLTTNRRSTICALGMFVSRLPWLCVARAALAARNRFLFVFPLPTPSTIAFAARRRPIHVETSRSGSGQWLLVSEKLTRSRNAQSNYGNYRARVLSVSRRDVANVIASREVAEAASITPIRLGQSNDFT